MSESAAGGVMRFGSGQAVRRVEDASLLIGQGQFTDDMADADTLVLAFLRSPYARARIVSIDVEAARAMPGVVSVVTAADLVAGGVKALPHAAAFKRGDGSGAVSPPRFPLADGFIRFAGEAVAAVVAHTREQARDALEAIALDVEDLPSVTALTDAVADGAPVLWHEAPDNVAAQARYGDVAATQAAFEAAAHVVTLDPLVNQRLAPASIEPRTVMATHDPASDRLTIRMSTQMPAGVRNLLADTVLGCPKEKIRVIVGDVGGGFGMKTGLYPEDAVVAWCARNLSRTVLWTADRSEEFLSAVHGRDTHTRAQLALDANGRIQAFRVHSLANVGAYATPTGVAIQLLIGPWVLSSIYDIGLVDFDFRAVLTNTAPTGAYRGAGRPESIYIIERLMDAAARQIGMDGAELRRRNMIRPEQMPYRNPMGQVYDTGQFEKVMDQGLALADWGGFEARAAQSKARGRLRGLGLATFLEWTGGNALEERVTVNVKPDGIIELVSATQAMGQGLATTYAQLAVDIFRVPLERIRVIQGDTDLATGFGSAGSRSLFTGGTAVSVASELTIQRARSLAADALEVGEPDIEYTEALFRVVGTDRSIGLFELAARQPEQRIQIDSTSTVAGPTWPNGCHVCEVELDPATGETEVVAYSSVNDVGRVVNPIIVRGQLDGGALQGIGQALCENVVYDRESGQLVSGSFLDYTLPRADMRVPFRTEMDESTPCLNNPLGVKGVGELGTIGATPAVVNAVVDALARAGVDTRAHPVQMPVTPEQVWRVLATR
ncbi:MAG: xanthine dehydrogenase family protein molybdopterin-binding subunit [Burkholderiales bacterium]|nr:xanthine dehydrogenase family protein molybdopterin-binding subunit [Burkholderiales bacterium]